jgi:hypothetical protein
MFGFFYTSECIKYEFQNKGSICIHAGGLRPHAVGLFLLHVRGRVTISARVRTATIVRQGTLMAVGGAIHLSRWCGFLARGDRIYDEGA